MFGAVAATSLLLTLAGSAAAEGTPPKPADPAKPPATPAKAPEKAPAAAPSEPGKPFMEWEHLLLDMGGVHGKLFDKGFDVSIRLTDDYTRVMQGGADSYETSNRYWLDASVAIDLEKVAKLKGGGSIVASYWQTGGEDGSKDFGGFNDISSLDAEFRQELGELYYANRFLKDAFDTRIGKMDPTERFNHSEYAGDFMNEAATFPVTFSPSPVNPESAVGADLFYVSKGLYAGMGVFDGSRQEGVETGHGGAAHLFGEPGDLFLVAEAGYRWNDGGRPVRAALGAWKHNGDFPSLTGHVYNGSTGFYVLAEGMLVKKDRGNAKDDRGAYLVLRYGSMEEGTTPVDWTSTVALVWKGTFASRKNDSIGLAWSYNSVTGDDGGAFRYSSEQVVEFYYRGAITPCISIAPGVQYVANPGATYGDAFVVGVRFEIDF